MRFDLTLGSGTPARQRGPEKPIRLLILSDLRGQSTDPETPLLDRPIAQVDVDNLSDLLARYAPSVIVDGERLEFRAFDDFHPDALVARVPVFGRLRDLRARLQNPRTSSAAIAELKAETGTTVTADSVRAGEQDDQSTVERLLGRKSPDAAVQRSPAALNSIEGLIRDAVAPHIVPASDPHLPEIVAAVDLALGDVMRRVLHDSGFQAVEAAWRGIAWLVSSLELGEDLELYLLHATRDELPRHAAGSDLPRRLVEREAQTEGGLEFSALIGNYRFDATSDDLTTLQTMGDLAGTLGAPFVAECGASLLGSRVGAQQPDPRDWQPLDSAIAAQWAALRTGSAGRHVGLAVPRFLLRLPYGRRSDPVEAFSFEEQPPTPDHESFLWGNPAFACAVVLARVLQGNDAVTDVATITDLPAFTFSGVDEQRLQPCAEVCLTETGIDAIVSRGIMPLVSFKDRNAIRLVRLQSIADPPAALLD
jgi:type VI secretion system ImpC/EvpB family protein/type VI secretion system ImpB/VipA family protein